MNITTYIRGARNHNNRYIRTQMFDFIRDLNDENVNSDELDVPLAFCTRLKATVDSKNINLEYLDPNKKVVDKIKVKIKSETTEKKVEVVNV